MKVDFSRCLPAYLSYTEMATTVRLVLFVSFVTRVLSQAPGDGDSFCVDAVINGVPNVFFTNVTYPANERPLMDSRDYVGLLYGPNPPWQEVDNDNNNDHEIVSHVRYSVLVHACVCSNPTICLRLQY